MSQRLAAHCKSIVAVDLSQAMVDQFNKQVRLAASRSGKLLIRAQVSDHGVDPSEMHAVQKDELLDEDSELDGQLFDVVIVRPVLPLARAKLTILQCCQTYHHIPDVVGITKALSRRLKPGGKLVVIDLDSESGWGEAITSRMSKEKAEQLSKVVVHRGGPSYARIVELFRRLTLFRRLYSHATSRDLRVDGPLLECDGGRQPQDDAERDEGAEGAAQLGRVRHRA